jgi:ATP-binding cassette subfamily G (WHITE) protein 2 (SNQ2)
VLQGALLSSFSIAPPPLLTPFRISAGKTTLLETVSQRKTTGVVEGSFLIDGKPLAADFARTCAFVMQADVHEPLSTYVSPPSFPPFLLRLTLFPSFLFLSHLNSVRECIQFSALLRQPASVSREEKLAYAEEVIELLELQEVADAIVGNAEIGGLGIEEKKRLTIAVEVR